jgi:hypothetical protein
MGTLQCKVNFGGAMMGVKNAVVLAAGRTFGSFSFYQGYFVS